MRTRLVFSPAALDALAVAAVAVIGEVEVLALDAADNKALLAVLVLPVRAGASGFLLKTAPPRQLIAAIRDITGGDTLVAPAITRRLVEEFVHRPRPDTAPAELSRLTPRELEVLKLIAKGLSNSELASNLFISETTAKTHVARILNKLGLRDRVQAVVIAYESGIVRPGGNA